MPPGTASIFHRLAGGGLAENLLAFQQHSPPRIPSLSHCQSEAAGQVLVDPLLYYLRLPSKRVRPALVQLAAQLLRLEPPALPWIKCYVESVHNASLLIDDLQDNSKLRRGEPCAHLRFGIDRAVTAGLSALAYGCEANLFARLNGLPAAQTFRLRELHRQTVEALITGAAIDVRWHGHTRDRPSPSLTDYLTMVRLKTAEVMVGGVRMLGTWAVPGSVHVQAICRAYSLYAEAFQINDDLLNIEGGAYYDLKGFGEDITEGKLSYVVVRMCEEVPESRESFRLLEILDAAEKAESEISEALEILRASPFVKEGRRLCYQLASQSREILHDSFPAEASTLALWDEVLAESFPQINS